ncbi:ABC transporter substrate-binding protein [Roseococcus sp. YIM B11640]|uniref:ABC transporter substrate-binding protein n=1 Tax=Roseococcus sp. YIM B11640 TaxID=3133973 RepID=UPI003C7BE9F8
MRSPRRELLAAASGLAVLPFGPAWAQARAPLRLGVLTDLSGPYRDPTGPGSVACVQQALSDFAGGLGLSVEMVQADHQNRPDLGANIARQWFDQGVDVIIDVPTSSVALAVSTVARQKNKVLLNSGAATVELTGTACSPNTVHWTYDTWMMAKGTGAAVTRNGGDSWFFITADYAFGHALQRDVTQFVEAEGGRAAGSIRYPFPATTDFSSFLLAARASRAKVLGFANAGADTANCVIQAREFGLHREMRLVGLLMSLHEVHSLGLSVARDLMLTEAFYWDMDARSRAFSQRVQPRMPGQAMPGAVQAGCYSAVAHYLKAAASLGAAAAKADGAATVARMKAMPTEDDAFGSGAIRADGRKLHPSYLFQVKSPEESRGAWDYYRTITTNPADQAFRPLHEGGCPLVRGSMPHG